MTHPYLAWNSLEVRLGERVDAPGHARLDVAPWRVRDAYPARGMPLVAAVGTGPEEDALLLLRPGAPPKVLFQGGRLLHVALRPDGGALAYTRPAGTPSGEAELWTRGLEEDGPGRRLAGGLSQDSPLDWHPRADRVACHGPAGVLVVPAEGGPAERVAEGRCPAFAPDGEALALLHGDALVVRDAAGERARVDLGRRGLAPVLSWSADGRHVAYGRTAGLVGKQTAFDLLDLQTRRTQTTRVEHATGLRLLPWAPGRLGTA